MKYVPMGLNARVGFKGLPQRLKPRHLTPFFGTAKAVPFPRSQLHKKIPGRQGACRGPIKEEETH
jgi:hypothetical protein